MSSGYNVFEPDDLAFAQCVLDEVWAAMPNAVRADPASSHLREHLARCVLMAMTDGDVQRDVLTAALVQSHAKGNSVPAATPHWVPRVSSRANPGATPRPQCL
ncbi:hypothetical protein [Hyphomicrobium methylovorum]|uniref:hypothetical protein n=1 Tax=Hyphomicrobium methylovorum TaxID=84 RepID=UPI0015E7A24D|nr:hypothetical protein [Hyphomicrobium methylovorum]